MRKQFVLYLKTLKNLTSVMKKTGRKGLNWFIFGLIAGMAAMFLPDMAFHFNNSVEKGVIREIDKTVNKVEVILN